MEITEMVKIRFVHRAKKVELPSLDPVSEDTTLNRDDRSTYKHNEPK